MAAQLVNFNAGDDTTLILLTGNSVFAYRDELGWYRIMMIAHRAGLFKLYGAPQGVEGLVELDYIFAEPDLVEGISDQAYRVVRATVDAQRSAIRRTRH